MINKLVLENKQYDFDFGILQEFEDYSKYHESHNKLLGGAKTYFPESGKYLGSVLHDSRILSVDYRKNDYFNIMINDIRYIDFCWALQELEGVKIPFQRVNFSVVLRFSGLKKCLAHCCNRNNKLLPLKTEKYTPKINEFLYDEIQKVGESYIDLALHLCTTMWRTRKYKYCMLLLKSFRLKRTSKLF